MLKRIVVGALFVVGSLIGSFGTWAQDPPQAAAPVDKTVVPAPNITLAEEAVGPTRVVGVWLATVDVDGQEIQVFAMPGNLDNVVYTAPYRFQLDKDNKVEVVVLDEKKDGKTFLEPVTFTAKDGKTAITSDYPNMKRVVVSLIRNPQGTRSKIAQALRLNGIRPNITEANVNPADVSYLEIEENTLGVKESYRFRKFSETYPSGQTIRLETLVADTEEDSFRRWIQSGTVSFKITQRVVGERIDWQQTLDLEAKAMQQIDTQIDAEGPVVPGDIVKGLPAYVTRKQRDAIMDRAMNNVKVEISTMGNAPDGSISQILGKLLEQAFEPAILGPSNTELWNRLQQQDLSKNGLEPSKITKFIDDARKLHVDSGSKEWNAALATSANAELVGIFKAGGTLNASGGAKETWNNTTDDHVVTTREGEFMVPVGFRVFRVSTGFQERAKNVSIRNVGTQKAYIETRTVITTGQPAMWTVKSVLVNTYKLDEVAQLRKLLLSRDLVETTQDVAALQTLVPPVGTPQVVAPPTLDANGVEVPRSLVRGRQIPLWEIQGGVGGAAPAPNEVYLLTVSLLNESGDPVIHQLLLIGLLTGELKPLGVDYSPVEYLMIDRKIVAQMRGPASFTKPVLLPGKPLAQ